MPTYQYACTECDETLERFQSFSDEALTACPRCEGRLRKVYNAVGVVFKGSGFYRNDSRTDGKSAKAGSASGPSSESGAPTTADSGSAEAGSSEKKAGTTTEKTTEKKKAENSTGSTSAA